MTAIDPQRVAAWITVLKGDRTQGELARDISETTGWSIDRSRVSRYERGELPVGRDVLAKLSEYAAKRDLPAYDPTPPAPEPSIEERHLALLERQVIAQERQAAAMELHVRLLARQTIATEAIAAASGATLPTTDDDWIAHEDALLALGLSVLADRRSQALPSAHLPLGEG